MSGFTRIEIDGYRRLRNVKLDLRPLCVLIGGNGSGKTSLLEVFSLLAASAEGKLREKLSSLGGFTSVATVGGSSRLELGLMMGKVRHPAPLHNGGIARSAFGYQPLHYQLELSGNGVGYEVSSESLTEVRYSNVRPLKHIESNKRRVQWFDAKTGRMSSRRPFTVDAQESALSQLRRGLAGPAEFRNQLASCRYYRPFSLDARSPARVPQPLQTEVLPGRDGEFLASCLYNLKESYPDRYEAVEDTLRVAFPGFKKLVFPSVAAGTLAMAWQDENFPQGFYAHQLAEGMLRFLWLVALLQSPGLPTVTLIDEPETSLHPELLCMLADLLREASLRSQIIVATHSPMLVRALKPEDVIVADRDEKGLAHFTKASRLDLKAWLEDYTLDEVWNRGLMGASR